MVFWFWLFLRNFRHVTKISLFLPKIGHLLIFLLYLIIWEKFVRQQFLFFLLFLPKFGHETNSFCFSSKKLVGQQIFLLFQLIILLVWQFFLLLLQKNLSFVKSLSLFLQNLDRLFGICFLIAGIYPPAELQRWCSWLSDQWQHTSSQGLRDMCCSLYLTLDQQIVFSVARITGVANLPLRMWSSS